MQERFGRGRTLDVASDRFARLIEPVGRSLDVGCYACSMPMFDTFVSERSKRQRKGLRYTMSFSAFLHVVAGVVLVGWSFWKIEKIMPRYVPVSFTSDFKLPPPPPEPPPPPPVHEVSKPTTPGPSHPKDPTNNIPTAQPRLGGDPTVEWKPPGDGPGDPNGIGLVPSLPPSEVLPPPLPPPKPPGLSDAERRALVLAYLDKVQPHVLRHFAYPSDAQRNGVEGTVIVRLTIDAQGGLREAKVVSYVDPLLVNAALQSAHEAAPFPHPPAELGTVTVDVRFEYHLD